MQECKHCISKNIKVGFAFRKNGSKVFPLYCEDCGQETGKLINKENANSVNYILKEIVFTSSNTGYLNKIKCYVCGDENVEAHHFAPKHLFGDEAEKWPVAYLCKFHHKKWHDIVTPNMNKK